MFPIDLAGIRKPDVVSEYAKAVIPLYWIIELDPDPKVTVLSLGDGGYELVAEVRGTS